MLYFINERKAIMGKTNTKKMVQGAMIAAIFGALSLFNTYTGSMFDIFICYAMVVPLVWYGYTYSFKDNLIVCIVSMIVIAMMGLPFFVISSLSSCLAGLFIGEALRRKAKKETILLGTLCTTFLNNIFIYEVFAGLLDINLIDEMSETYQMFVTMMPTLASNISLDMFLSMIPLILLIMSALEMYVIVMLCQIILFRLKIEFPGSFHIALMHMSRQSGIILLIMLFGSTFLQSVMHIKHIVLTYMMMLGELALAMQGLSLACFLLIAFQKPKWMILAFIGLFIPVIQMLYIGMGILDIFSDLRRNLLYNNDSK